MIANPQSPNPSPSPLAQDPPEARWLLAWLDDNEAIPLVLGHPLLPTDDLASVRGRIDNVRKARAARQPWQQANPVVPGDASVLRALAARQNLQTAFAGTSWRPAHVDLRRVLSLQKHMSIAGQAERVAKTPLLDLCLPTSSQPELRCSQDGDGKGMTLSSRDLNLRVAGVGFSEVQVSPGVTRPAVQVFVDVPMSLVTVARFKGRFYLRDGYHRTGGLLRAGMPIVPCVVVDVNSMQELAPAPTLFSEAVLFDDRPPALTDFWDDSVVYAGHRPGQRFIRVRGDEVVH